MKTATFTALSLLAFLGAASAQTPKTPAAVGTSGTGATTSTANDYRLAAGDKLRIEVYKDAQLSQSLQVRPDGKITLPLVGDVPPPGHPSPHLPAPTPHPPQAYIP